MNFDLDKARAEREAKKEVPTFTFRGQEFTLPISLPIEVAEAQAMMGEGTLLRNAAITEAEKILAGAKSNIGYMKMGLAFLGEEQFARFRELGGTADDLSDVINWLFPLYGTDAGKSLPSGGSSKTTGESSRQTSNGSTDLTSQELSGEMEDLASGAGA